jgi:hypothetical protein
VLLLLVLLLLLLLVLEDRLLAEGRMQAGLCLAARRGGLTARGQGARLLSSAGGAGGAKEEGGAAAPVSLVDRIKNFFLFAPDRTSYETYANKAVSGKGYRFPSPASATPPDHVTPTVDSLDDVYNTQFYTRDTARASAGHLIGISDSAPGVAALKIPSTVRDPDNMPPEAGSPGNKNPAVLRYDPTGTRSAMTTTWAAMDKELEKHTPDHLPTAWHVRAGIDDVKWTNENKLPPRPGKPMPWTNKEVREGKW